MCRIRRLRRPVRRCPLHKSGGVRFQDGETADHFFRFAKGPVSHGQFAARGTHACAKLARQATFGGEQPTGLKSFLDQFSHRGHFFLRWGCVSFCRLVDAQESHVHFSLSLSFFLQTFCSCVFLNGLNSRSTIATSEGQRNRHGHETL